MSESSMTQPQDADLRAVIDYKMSEILRNASLIVQGLQADDKSFSADLHAIHEAGFMSASQELTAEIVSAVVQDGDRRPWDAFKERFAKIQIPERDMYRPVLGHSKKIIADILKGESPRHEHTTPSYVTIFGQKHPEMLKALYGEIEELEAADKSAHDDFWNAAAALGGAAAATGHPVGVAAGMAGGLGAGANIIGGMVGDAVADQKIRENQRRIEEEKRRQEELRQQRLSQKAKQYVQDGVTR